MNLEEFEEKFNRLFEQALNSDEIGPDELVGSLFGVCVSMKTAEFLKSLGALANDEDE